MPDVPSTPSKQNRIEKTDIAIGGGTGGLLIFIIENYVSDPSSKSLFLYCVPVVSTLLTGFSGAIVEFVSSTWSDFKAERARRKLLRSARAALVEVKAHVDLIEQDPGSTPELKSKARQEYEKLQLTVMTLAVKGIIKHN